MYTYTRYKIRDEKGKLGVTRGRKAIGPFKEGSLATESTDKDRSLSCIFGVGFFNAT